MTAPHPRTANHVYDDCALFPSNICVLLHKTHARYFSPHGGIPSASTVVVSKRLSIMTSAPWLRCSMTLVRRVSSTTTLPLSTLRRAFRKLALLILTPGEHTLPRRLFDAHQVYSQHALDVCGWLILW